MHRLQCLAEVRKGSMISSELIKLLVCPETKRPVSLADAATVERVNEQIRSRAVKDRSGAVVEAEIEGGLMTDDLRFLYPVRDEIPVMLIDQAIVIKEV